MYIEVDSFGTVKFGYILGFVHGSTSDQFSAFPLSEFTFFEWFHNFQRISDLLTECLFNFGACGKS